MTQTNGGDVLVAWHGLAMGSTWVNHPFVPISRFLDGIVHPIPHNGSRLRTWRCGCRCWNLALEAWYPTQLQQPWSYAYRFQRRSSLLPCQKRQGSTQPTWCLFVESSHRIPRKSKWIHYIPRIASSMNFILPLVCCRWTHQLQCQQQARSHSWCEAWDLGVEKSKASSHAWSGQTTICVWLVHLLYMVMSMDWFKGRLKLETSILAIFPEGFPLNKSIDHFQKVLKVCKCIRSTWITWVTWQALDWKADAISCAVSWRHTPTCHGCFSPTCHGCFSTKVVAPMMFLGF